MMKFKSVAAPKPQGGKVYKGPKAVVPNMALSLEEIIKRFVRGEKVPVGMGEPMYDDGPEDLEKVRNMDLVDRQEYIDKLKATQARFEKEERGRRKAAKEKAAAVAAAALAKGSTGGAADAK